MPSEIEDLPGRVKDKLRRKSSGPFEVIAPEPLREGENHTCCFFDKGSALHCSIHEHRPMKCRLYPFLPLVVGGKIEIFAEPLLDIWSSSDEKKE
ncbi:hypothetical protein AKJ37_03645 [candidate division MSBL1 archaeon SCGC-AAA259I09]|uniref:Uncharacterized protein n=1 Tax=candidate division MSBL1 archaeon SCGC-AAA259I09 TaxID=1698267 RepID=A0A133USR2_9EURY|nr:hypothetical protein AKJ37_03645 [candidate division MSBL1 archaeon SCGC-AAA259I09]